MSEPLTKEKAQDAASALGSLILCTDVSDIDKDVLKAALATAWRIYDRVGESE